MYEVSGQRYLEVKEQIPAGETPNEWKPVKEGCWMPFDGGPSNGGKWLHDPNTWKPADGDDSLCRRL